MCIRDRPLIVAQYPDVLYRIVGATHPNLVAAEGEAYRESLEQLAESLGVCLLYTSDAADERSSVDLGGRRLLKQKKTSAHSRY